MQNYSNHRKSDWAWLVGFFILLAMTGLTLRGVVSGYMGGELVGFSGDMILNIIITIAPLILLWVMLFKLRGYATTLQDRIIRQEVNFRHYLATGKELDPALTIKQIVALRFAGDVEFVGLCEKALAENLGNKQIKQMITEWKADDVRV